MRAAASNFSPGLAGRGPAVEPVPDHGGSLAAAAALFPDAPGPWLDLSTGINPHPYPLPPLPPEAFTRLPEPADLARLCAAAAAAYGAPPGCVVAAPGTQALLPLIAALVPPGRAVVLGPTYAEHARAARLAGHAVEETVEPGRLRHADLAVVVNPNNPDGRVISRSELLALAPPRGLLVVDEAFAEASTRPPRLAASSAASSAAGALDGDAAEASVGSIVGDVAGSNVVVLRSFGKFYGLAGVRLGFAVGDAAPRLAALLGPWAVSGPAIAAGLAALPDAAWRASMRQTLAADVTRLDALLAAAGLRVPGGTLLFRFVRSERAPGTFDRLGRAGILVRRFAHDPAALRFGIPGSEAAFARLAAALQ